MNWVIFIWSVTAGICLTLGGIHVLLWVQKRDAWSNLVFAIGAFAAAGYATHDMFLMNAATPTQYGELARWTLVLGTVVALALVLFVRLHLQAGRLWLLWLICGLRALMLVLNFASEPNFYFRDITELQPVSLLGQDVLRPVGVPRLWNLLQPLSHVLIIVFALDAARTAARRSGRKAPWATGGSVAAGVALASLFSVLRTWGILPSAFAGQLILLPITVLAYQLTLDVLRASRLAKSLQESEARMELAVNAADLGLWEWDIVHDEIWATEKARHRMALGNAERMNFNRVLELIHPEDRDAVRQAVQRAMEGNGELEMEYRVITPDGVMHWIAAHGQTERGAHGKPTRMRGVSFDITERKQAAEAFHKQRNELAFAQRVSEMGQLASALAHELSQPLGAILRNSEAAELFLRKDPPDLEEIKEIIKDIQRDDQRAAAVIERIHALLKRRDLKLETVVLDDLVQGVLTLLQTEIQLRHAMVSIDIPREIPRVKVDRVLLQQVILNLAVNGLDAMVAQPHQQRQLLVRASQADEGLVEVAVIDRGTGIPPEQLPHIFEPFTTTKKNGTGIGLAVSKTIVESHGGIMQAENNPTGGATFRFTLQAAECGGELVEGG